MSIYSEFFGTLKDGRSVERWILERKPYRCSVITYGGILTELWVPDARGELADVVLGLPSLEAYEKGHPYFGAITGRVAGRIKDGRFELEGETYQLAINDPPNHLHGGLVALDKRVWSAEASETEDADPCLILRYHSPDGEEGYPGTVDFTVRYTLRDEGILDFDWMAETDRTTPLSLTNHAYFNLTGEGSGSTGGHEMQIFSKRMVTGDRSGTLADETSSVEGTEHDFRTPKPLAEFIAPPEGSHGEYYLFEGDKWAELRPAARVLEPLSGRCMEVFTNAAGMQFYSGKFLGKDALTGKSGSVYANHGAFCLECHGFPDGVRHPEIDDILLHPGEHRHERTRYRFFTASR